MSPKRLRGRRRRPRPRRWPDSRPVWRKPLWRITILLVLVAGAFLVRLVEETGEDITPDQRFMVSRILDGDTFELASGERVRLLFIDTPEKGEPFADSATALVTRVALGEVASLRFGSRKRDGYGRLLAVAFVDSLDLAQELLRRGYASIYLFRDNLGDPRQEEELERALAAQRDAIGRKVGIWSLERFPENEYVTTRRSLRFHRPSCRSVAGRAPAELRHFHTRNEALTEGLSPCRNCRP